MEIYPMTTQGDNHEWWGYAIQKRYEYLEHIVFRAEKIESFGEFVLAQRIAECYHFGPRHQLNQNGWFHAALIKLTDKWGYEEKE
jgi:hypothetical protein